MTIAVQFPANYNYLLRNECKILPGKKVIASGNRIFGLFILSN